LRPEPGRPRGRADHDLGLPRPPPQEPGRDAVRVVVGRQGLQRVLAEREQRLGLPPPARGGGADGRARAQVRGGRHAAGSPRGAGAEAVRARAPARAVERLGLHHEDRHDRLVCDAPHQRGDPALHEAPRRARARPHRRALPEGARGEGQPVRRRGLARLRRMSGDLSPSLFGEDGDAVTVPPAAFEQKFLVTPEVAARVAAWARAQMRPDPHGDPHAAEGGGSSCSGDYFVTTLYLDTPDFAVFHRAPELQGAKYRIRRYGAEPVAWLEKKVRTGDRVHKRRLRVELPEIARLGAPRWFDEEVADLGLAPTCAVAYRRTAFLGSGDHGPFRL